MTTRVDYHSETAGVFLAKAGGYLAEEDLLQASEKGLGGGGADGQGGGGGERLGRTRVTASSLWPSDRLVEETGDEQLRVAFGLANVLHINFYDGLLPREDVEAYLAHIREFVGRLEALLAS